MVGVMDCVAASMDGANASESGVRRGSGVPDLLAAFLALPINDVIGEDHLTEIAAYLGRRAAIATWIAWSRAYLYEARKSNHYGRGSRRAC